MKKIACLLFFLSFCLLCSPVFARVEAASLQFNPSSASTTANSSFTIDIVVNPGSEQINSAESYILFDPTLLEAQSVTDGTYFSSVSNIIEAGRVYVAGMVEDNSSYKTGTGTIARINFKALTDGTATLTFDCPNTKIVKADINATNIATCSEMGTATVVIGSGGGGGGSQPAPTTYTPPSTLPQTGILENLQKAAIPGLILVVIGGIIKLLI